LSSHLVSKDAHTNCTELQFYVGLLLEGISEQRAEDSIWNTGRARRMEKTDEKFFT
jgi:hypothetical protein